MSHVTKIDLKVRDLDALEEAADQLGLELRREQKKYAWWGRFVGDSHEYGDADPKTFGRCEHALRIKGTTPHDGSGGPWEIGVVPAKDGDGYTLLYDRYGSAGRQLEEKVGARCAKLKQEYACAVTTKRARATIARKGFELTREGLAGGRIRLRLRKR